MYVFDFHDYLAGTVLSCWAQNDAFKQRWGMAVTASKWCLRFKASLCHVTYDGSCFFSLICPETLGFSYNQNELKIMLVYPFFKEGRWFNIFKKYFTSHFINYKTHLITWYDWQNKILHDTHCQHLFFCSLACILDASTIKLYYKYTS